MFCFVAAHHDLIGSVEEPDSETARSDTDQMEDQPVVPRASTIKKARKRSGRVNMKKRTSKVTKVEKENFTDVTETNKQRTRMY